LPSIRAITFCCFSEADLRIYTALLGESRTE